MKIYNVYVSNQRKKLREALKECAIAFFFGIALSAGLYFSYPVFS